MSTHTPTHTLSQKEMIQRRAGEIYWAGKARTYFEAMRIAYNENRLRLALDAQAAVYITFKKKEDGTHRDAMITTKSELMPQEIKPKGTGGGYTSFQIRFVDMLIGEWRSCLIQNIIKIHW